jgi:uncharacterized membrane protein YeiB
MKWRILRKILVVVVLYAIGGGFMPEGSGVEQWGAALSFITGSIVWSHVWNEWETAA